MSKTRMIVIDAPHFYAAVILNTQGDVVMAAPIVKYMITWHRKGVIAYCRRKGWTAYEQ